MALSVFALCGFAMALAAPFLPIWRSRPGRWLAAGVPAASFGYFLTLTPRIGDGEVVTYSRDWIPSLGISFALRVDGLSLLMALLVSGMGAIVVLYAGAYLQGKPGLGRFMAYLFGFMGSMLGLVLAADMITLFVYWELTSITSHNPFAVNDVYFSRELPFDPEKMNRHGSSLVWGHPQGPTGIRAILELIEDLVLQGGGYGLLTGCAAGDSAAALTLKVSVS